MKNALLFDFVVNKEEKTITLKKEFAANVALVWDAFTKKELLEQWWAPKPYKAKVKTLDLKEGGTWHYAMVGPGGEMHWSIVKYGKIVPGKMYTGLTAFTDAEGNVGKGAPQSNWEVTFTPKGDDAALVQIKVSYTDVAHLEAMIKMGFKEGITMTINYLAELLPTLK
ncbi:MAG TPA: SRPBCC domain-containing protein [Bacteroidia bacterium]|nr:SRPBCC domain-containing protein [Bacteroidia bacterium]